ncbi:MAG: cytochrome P450 [Solirubrobacteraceae bacterium]|nr:MAG: cytochrome P450 [Solirubrobacterales bacterium]
MTDSTAPERSRSLPPGPPYPRALQTLGWMRRPGPFLERCRERYGDTFTLRIAHEDCWIVLSDPDVVKEVFTGNPATLHAGEANAILRPLLGDQSVLLLDDEAHLVKRKLMLPSFHGERMERYGELMREIAEREIASWPRQQTLALLPQMQALTLEVIMRAVFGVDRGPRLDRLRALLRRLLDYTMDPRTLVPLVLLGPERLAFIPQLRRVFDQVDLALHEEIAQRRQEPGLAERDDVLSLLLEARYDDGTGMSDQELRDQLMTLLVAGHETTATALSWAIERLVRHPDKLQRLRDDVAAGSNEYVDAVAKETLRLRPVIPIVVRQLVEPMEIGGWALPAGIRVAPCIHLIHRRPDIYPEPARFRPERFLESPPGTYTWIPFGGGIRRCLGASFALFEMQVVLGAIVTHARLRAPVSAGERVRRRAITWTPSRGAEVLVEADDARAPNERTAATQPQAAEAVSA